MMVNGNDTEDNDDNEDDDDDEDNDDDYSYNDVYQAWRFNDADALYKSASSHLVVLPVRSESLHHLRQLSLSMITTEDDLSALFSTLHVLRHLILDDVSLIPKEGCWESALICMADSLRLETLKLSALGDFVNSPRMILDSSASAWKSKRYGRSGYSRYGSAIT